MENFTRYHLPLEVFALHFSVIPMMCVENIVLFEVSIKHNQNQVNGIYNSLSIFNNNSIIYISARLRWIRIKCTLYFCRFKFFFFVYFIWNGFPFILKRRRDFTKNGVQNWNSFNRRGMGKKLSNRNLHWKE